MLRLHRAIPAVRTQITKHRSAVDEHHHPVDCRNDPDSGPHLGRHRPVSSVAGSEEHRIRPPDEFIGENAGHQIAQKQHGDHHHRRRKCKQLRPPLPIIIVKWRLKALIFSDQICLFLFRILITGLIRKPLLQESCPVLIESTRRLFRQRIRPVIIICAERLSIGTVQQTAYFRYPLFPAVGNITLFDLFRSALRRLIDAPVLRDHLSDRLLLQITAPRFLRCPKAGHCRRSPFGFTRLIYILHTDGEIKRNAQYHRQQQKCQPAPCPGQNLPDLIVDLLFSVMSICYFLMPHSFVRHVFMWNFLIHRHPPFLLVLILANADPGPLRRS